MENKKVKVSALNLVPQFQGEATIDAINRAVELGKILENLDYHRYWIAEHHNFRGVVSSATALLIQHILSNTKKLKLEQVE
ncbi:luciferase family monooxygenase [Fusobacterium animalis ATCC 51191]|uniref:Luciferase family monooxygenase n=1 Tax=Fusobacterium animalis ATCC 51191 TaxID=997347 RepID=F9EK65_9FUSO|nr:luciferase family monooxygenase [Fusobacterium animalis ATCC 51191]